MIKVVKKGVETLVEDWPGRLGYLSKGMSTSGAMDNLALRFVNLLVGNPVTEAGLEITGGFLELEFEEDAIIAIGGSDTKPILNNNDRLPLWKSIYISKGSTLKFFSIGEYGFRTYLGIAGGIEVPYYLGSKSTCVFGNYGGFKGRSLNEGDILKVGKPSQDLKTLANRKLKEEIIPKYQRIWEIKAIPGPNSMPDYITREGMEWLFESEHKVSHLSNRSAYRLNDVPSFFFARKDGGVGGTHPSNIIDHGYAVPGTLNITGNTPSILCVDGPTLGGYINALQIIYADLWKIGQVTPLRDKIKFSFCTQKEAANERQKQLSLFTENNIVK